MAGSMALNDYHKIGHDILKEQQPQNVDMEMIGDGAYPDEEQEKMLAEADKVTRQMLASNEFPMTDGGIQAAIEEGIKRVYAEYGQELNPDEIANLASTMDFGPYIPQPEVYGDELKDARQGKGTVPKADTEQFGQRRPIEKPVRKGNK